MSNYKSWTLLILLVLSVAYCNQLKVSLTNGKAVGSVVNILGKNIHVWKNLSYARAERWKRPTEPSPLSPIDEEGYFHAINTGYVCPQYPTEGNIGLYPAEAQSENCLNLNVYSTCTRGEYCNVAFWMFPGSFVGGSAEMIPIERLLALLKEDVHEDSRFEGLENLVIVAPNYRLGVLNFMTTETMYLQDPEANSQFGVMDIISALNWTRHNIEEFGGDPDSVTLIGQSSGCTVQFSLFGSPDAAGYFNGAICLSGSPNVSMDWREASKQIKKYVIDFTPCSNASGLEQLQCLKNMSFTDIIAAMDNPITSSSLRFNYGGYPASLLQTPESLYLPANLYKEGPMKKNSTEALRYPYNPDLAVLFYHDSNEVNFVNGFDKCWPEDKESLWQVWEEYYSGWGPGAARELFELFPYDDGARIWSKFISSTSFAHGNHRLAIRAAQGGLKSYLVVNEEDPPEPIPVSIPYCSDRPAESKLASHGWGSIMIPLELTSHPFPSFANGNIQLSESNLELARETRLMWRVFMKYKSLSTLGLKTIDGHPSFPAKDYTLVMKGKKIRNVLNHDREVYDTYDRLGVNESHWITN